MIADEDQTIFSRSNCDIETVVQGSAVLEIALPIFNICLKERLLGHGVARELSALSLLAAISSDLGGPIRADVLH